MSTSLVNIATSGNMKVLVARIGKGEDLRVKLDSLLTSEGITSAFVISCVGSLSRATIRCATLPSGEHEMRLIDQYMEIVSLVGTLSPQGSHLHISLSDAQGQVVGGHLLGGEPCVVQTTAEIVLGYLEGVSFLREMDETTGYKELVIRKKID